MTKDYSKITLLVDMDDTIDELLPAWVQWLNEKFGTNVTPKEITEWKISTFFPTLSERDVYSPLYNNRFWKTVKPKKDAIKYLQQLTDKGFSIYICTNSIYSTIKVKLDCVLSRYFPFIPRKNVITIANKQLLTGDILIDDGIHNLIGGKYAKFLMTAPHNAEYNAAANGMIRVHSWQETYEKIIEYADRNLAGKTENN